jgi:hypothetical protein
MSQTCQYQKPTLRVSQEPFPVRNVWRTTYNCGGGSGATRAGWSDRSAAQVFQPLRPASTADRYAGESQYAPFSTKAALVVAEVMIGFEPVNAGQLDMPMGPQSVIQHIQFGSPTLPPMAYTMFCLRYEDECRTKPLFRGGGGRFA